MKNILIYSTIIFIFVSCNYFNNDTPNNDSTIDSTEVQIPIVEDTVVTDIVVDSTDDKAIDVIFDSNCMKCPWPELNEPRINPDGFYDLMIIARGCDCCKVTYVQIPDTNGITLLKYLDSFKHKLNKIQSVSCNIESLSYRFFYGTTLDLEKL